MAEGSNSDVYADAIEVIANPVAARLDSFIEGEILRWSQLHPTLSEPLDSLRRFVAQGGKRLRPAFCYWAFVGTGGDPLDPTIIDAGAALELLHSFALIHDDVMDASATRRGTDSVHVQFQKQHDESSFRGDARRFGEGVAVLVGDMAFVYADRFLNRAPRSALDVFTELRVELNIGQYLDISAGARNDATLPMAKRIAWYKSGKYTVERPMHLGAALLDRYEEFAAPFSNYGVPVGEAFQMRDDILGAFGDAEATGKPVGDDIREGKPTAIVALARQRSNDAQIATLERYGAVDLTDDEVTELQSIMIETEARADVERAIDVLVQEGLDALVNVKLQGEALERLEQLAYFVAGRDN